MNTDLPSPRYTPVIILLLLAALVLTLGLWATDRSSQTVAAFSETTSGKQAQKQYRWKMVTTWPKNLPGLGMGPENFARMVDEMSGGQLQVRVYGSGELVPALGVFEAVSQGVVELGHGAAYYWKGKLPASVFFTSVPFGLNAQEMNGWLRYGGGQALWEEIYAPFNILPMPGGNSGVQMGGWYNREINSVDDLSGLKMRIPGMGGEVFSRAGGTAVTIAGSEIYTSMQTGVIDATEWVGPFNDVALGLHQVAEYYYYPGWHEPGSTLELIINRDAFATLTPELQAIVRVAAEAVNQNMLDDYTAHNNAALQDLVENHGVQLRKLPDDVLRRLKETSEIVLAEYAAQDPLTQKVYDSFMAFREGAQAYHRISEQAFYNARDLD